MELPRDLLSDFEQNADDVDSEIQAQVPDTQLMPNTDTRVLGDWERFIWFGQSKKAEEQDFWNPS